MVAIWNSLPGVEPVKRFKSAKAPAGRIWESIQGLGEAAKPKAQPAKPKADKRAKRGPQSANVAPAKAKSGKKATAAKDAPKGKTAVKAPESTGPRDGSKTAQVVVMLQRKGGATLPEIMGKMGWQRHTVRGFMAGAMKKAGYKVESFKSDNGERTYRITRSITSASFLPRPPRNNRWRAFFASARPLASRSAQRLHVASPASRRIPLPP